MLRYNFFYSCFFLSQKIAWRFHKHYRQVYFVHSGFDYSLGYQSSKSADKKIFFLYPTKTYIVGAQKNHLNEMVLLSTQNIEILNMMS